MEKCHNSDKGSNLRYIVMFKFQTHDIILKNNL